MSCSGRLRAVEEELELAYPTSEGLLKALDLKARGHGDLIDLLLYATALTRGLRLLTRDGALVSFLEEYGESTGCVPREKGFLAKYAQGRARQGMIAGISSAPCTSRGICA